STRRRRTGEERSWRFSSHPLKSIAYKHGVMLLVFLLAIGFTVALMVSPRLRLATALLVIRALYLNRWRNGRAGKVYAGR
ncbi:MAG: hypothetical protein QXT91_04175, partial [Candidatus Caldarchaeum sp.]